MIARQSHRDVTLNNSGPQVSVSASHFALHQGRSVRCRSDHIAFPKPGTATIKCRPLFDAKFRVRWSVLLTLRATTLLIGLVHRTMSASKERATESDATPLSFLAASSGLPNYRADTWTIRANLNHGITGRPVSAVPLAMKYTTLRGSCASFRVPAATQRRRLRNQRAADALHGRWIDALEQTRDLHGRPLPPRAAGMPRASNSAEMARDEHSRPHGPSP